MERRRQKASLGDTLQPLGDGQPRKATGKSGFGEDLGSTSYKSKAVRPSIVKNPRAAKAKEEEERRKAKSRAASPDSSAEEVTVLDESADPIDFLSSRAPEPRPKPQHVPSTTNLKPGPQPPPFRKPQQPLQTKTRSTNPSTLKPTVARTTKYKTRGKSTNYDSDSSSSSRARPRKNDSSPPQPPSSQPSSPEDREPLARKVPARAPQPAPFARNRNSVKEAEKPSAPAPKGPAPPPWKAKSTEKVTSKQDLLGEDLDSTGPSASSQPDSESQGITSDMLKMLKIPRKNDKKTSAVASVPAKEPPAEPKKNLEAFPMAAYAKEAAAKQAVEDAASRSPRKRFKPDDVERLIQRAEEEELMGIDDETLLYMDPKDLCPFCDEPLPDNPSPDLLQLLAELRATAAPEPRLRNPLGLTAPLMTFINLCQMHRAESTHVERGRQNHWPSVIDWDGARERLKSSRVVKALRKIISDPHSSEFFATLYNVIKRDGALKAASIRGQLDTFELSFPGYYGEQGLLVFYDTLNELFPNLTQEESKPLTPRQFFMSVLVPEAATLLIEQDMDCTHEEALITLRDSRQYGLAMFPDRGGFFGSGKGDHMDEAGAKQLQWRKDMVESSNSSNVPDKDKSPLFTSRFLDTETDPDVLIVD